MLDQRPSTPRNLASVFFRAMGLAWPVQVAVVVIWLLIPHPSAAHPLATLLITLGAGGIYLPMLHPAADAGNRVLGNVGAALGIAYVSALVWAGGGLTSGGDRPTRALERRRAQPDGVGQHVGQPARRRRPSRPYRRPV